jgi:hypothetical protein
MIAQAVLAHDRAETIAATKGLSEEPRQIDYVIDGREAFLVQGKPL